MSVGKVELKIFNQPSCMFHTAYHVTKEGLPCLKYESFCELQQLKSIQLARENYKSNNACKIYFLNSIKHQRRFVARP